MRTVDYKEWKKQRGEVHSRMLQSEVSLRLRSAGGKPRDPEKEQALIEMGKAKFQRYIDSGKIVIISPTRWIYKIEQLSRNSK